MTLAPADERLLRRAIVLARQAREQGNEPFGALLAGPDGTVVVEAGNTVLTERDWTGHAEVNVVRAAGTRLARADLGGHTLYASTEPCPMCSAAAYWAGIGRVVYALGAQTFRRLAHADDGLALSCREVLRPGARKVEVGGPHLEEEAAEVHEGFW
jgi:tRNA(Arg) A34 adenosine deaminase TadA